MKVIYRLALDIIYANAMRLVFLGQCQCGVLIKIETVAKKIGDAFQAAYLVLFVLCMLRFLCRLAQVVMVF